MGKKKRGHPDIEEILARPWCYYCERDFEDVKLLISHQKAKHFKCDRCGKRLNTAGGLSVHMNQVHKETLTNVENALPNREGLDVEIFGMEGVPEDMVQQHNQRLIQTFYTEQAERRAATGNPPPGSARGQRPVKKIKIEDPSEIKKRLAEHRAAAAQRAAAGASVPEAQQPPPAVAAVYAGGSAGFPPTRPPHTGGAPAATTLDELVGGPSRGDDIDRVIRMAEAGIKPATREEPAAEKKGKKEKEKNVRMVWADLDVSPEERMAMLPRYVGLSS